MRSDSCSLDNFLGSAKFVVIVCINLSIAKHNVNIHIKNFNANQYGNYVCNSSTLLVLEWMALPIVAESASLVIVATTKALRSLVGWVRTQSWIQPVWPSCWRWVVVSMAAHAGLADTSLAQADKRNSKRWYVIDAPAFWKRLVASRLLEATNDQH